MKYIFITPQIVGNGEDRQWTTTYETDYNLFDTKEEAIKAGENETNSDDFLIGKIKKDGRIENLYWYDEEKDEGYKKEVQKYFSFMGISEILKH